MIKLYLDEDVHRKLAVALRLKGYDVVSAHEVKNWGISDAGQMEYAVREGRALFTLNTGDFSRLHSEYLRDGKEHFGILTSKHLPLDRLLKRLTEFLSKHEREEIRNGLFWV